MCGITGIFNLDGAPVSPVILRRMTDAVAHRGPDGEGFYTDSFLGFGHRRLAIIDLSNAGHQPMMTSNGQFVIVYNGEIYNFQELRLELESRGHQFRSRTDSEVALYAYAEWGPQAVERFNGMFAFAIWDKTRQELFLTRDRYGIKPLYYTLQNQTLLFGSEVKTILAHPAYSTELDAEALLEYFTFQNLFTDRTLFKDIHLLPAGCTLRAQLGKSDHESIQRYWDFNFREPEEPGDLNAYTEELDRLLQQAVIRQLVSDVDVGSYLSGGMDSGTITAIAATQLPYLKTFTCGFDLHSASGLELGFDERENSELMSYMFKTEHYEMVLKAGDMERIMPKLAWHIEEPRIGQSYPNFYAAQLASKFGKVVLSGGGGDEMFGGYPWRYYRAVSCNGFDNYIDKYYSYWKRLLPSSDIEKVFAPISPAVKNIDTREIFRSVFIDPDSMPLNRPEDYVNASLYFEAKTFLHGLLVVEDKLSMAHSLETRVPFLDNDLVDFAMRMPVSMKLRNLDKVAQENENDLSRYFRRTNDGKLLLRQAMSRYIPPEIANAEKQGFSAPDASWFKGESIEYVRREILDRRARIFDYLDRGTVDNLVSEHLDGRQNRRLLIWSLLSFEWWLRKYLD
jgi:asparagine synthase (glutamine-hydrolysing)